MAAAASGVPYAVHTRTYPYLHHPHTGRPIPESVVCTVAAGSMPTVRVMFETSTFVLFVCPIVLISMLYLYRHAPTMTERSVIVDIASSMLYALIGVKLRVTSPFGRVGRRQTDSLIQRRESTLAERRQHKSRSNVIRMLGTYRRSSYYTVSQKNVTLFIFVIT